MNDHERLKRARAVAAGAGRKQEHLRFVLDYLDRRTTELLEANNRLVDERRKYAMWAEEGDKTIEFLLSHNGIRQLSAVEDARCEVVEELELLRVHLGAALQERDDIATDRDALIMERDEIKLERDTLIRQRDYASSQYAQPS